MDNQHKLIKGYRDLSQAEIDHVPSRLELLVAYGELGAGKHVEKDWYWSSSQYAGSDAYAWFQSLHLGYQYDFHKDNQCRARAVRKIKI